MNVAIVGATGNVGRKVLEVLERKNLPFSEIYLVASPRSAGSKINFKGKDIVVENLETFDFSKAFEKSKVSKFSTTISLPLKLIFEPALLGEATK